MKNILFVKSSILNEYSISSKYGEKLISKFNDAKVVVRDVAKNLVPILEGKDLKGRGEKSGDTYTTHIELINEIKNSDVLVIAAPMYNFTIPVTLHAYFDALAIAGETFHYESDGTQVGHLKDKEAYVVLSRGGFYKDKLTFQEDYIKMFLHFLGIKKVEFIYVEGIAINKEEEVLEQQFEEQIKKLKIN